MGWAADFFSIEKSKRSFSSIRNFSSIQIVLFQHPGFLQHRTAGVFSASRVFSASMVFSQPSKESIFLASEQCFLRPECFLDAWKDFFSIEKEVFSEHQSGIFRASKCFLDTCGVFRGVRTGVFAAPKWCFSCIRTVFF